MKEVNKRHPLDVAAVFKEYGSEYLAQHTMCIDQQKAFRAICNCRTAAMGGHVENCNQCNHQRISYNSCRNRHCNRCQYTKQLIWVDKLEGNLPVCRYYHSVFTIPSELHKLFYINQRICYHLLFKATAQTLAKVGRNPQFLGADTGAVSVLHTWGQSLTFHPHIHMLIPAGGLSCDGEEWIHAKKNFFLPVKVLSKVFRGVLWSLLETELKEERIKLPDDVVSIWALKKSVYAKNWNVYTKKPLAGPQSVVRYLGKYTHRVAISNSRLVSIEKGKVTFSWKDYRKAMHKGFLTLDAQDFIHRFMWHILPSGFYKIRYYGILASANKVKKELCTTYLGQPTHTSILQSISTKDVIKIVLGKDLNQCTKCKKGRMQPTTILDPP